MRRPGKACEIRLDQYLQPEAGPFGTMLLPEDIHEYHVVLEERDFSVIGVVLLS
jgi:hypothetical protein